MSWICPKCETENQDDLMVCEVCDAPLVMTSAEKLKKKYTSAAYVEVIKDNLQLLIDADSGIASLQRKLGGYFESKDYKKEACEWYKKAAKQGDTSAQYSLARCYEIGYGIKKNYSASLSWYKKAADADHSRSIRRLAKAYALGDTIVKKDIEQAVYWANQCMSSVDTSVLYEIGACYEKGEGVCENKDVAMDWYVQAAQRGNRLAKERYTKLYPKHTSIQDLCLGFALVLAFFIIIIPGAFHLPSINPLLAMFLGLLITVVSIIIMKKDKDWHNRHPVLPKDL